MNFTKIKHSRDGQVVLKWTTDSGRDSVRHELESFDKPEPEFDAALAALLPEVLRILELPEEYAKGMQVIGVSLSSNDEQGLGCVVTCLRDLNTTNAPLVLNTPHLPESSESGPTMGRTMLDMIEKLQGLARRYVAGNREQMSLLDAA
jgi:hypothetical protein